MITNNGAIQTLFNVTAKVPSAIQQAVRRRVVAVDYDLDSVNTTKSLFERYTVAVPHQVERFDTLSGDALSRYGLFDVVYSWGVLHHTGDMWRAIENAAHLVRPDGVFVFSLYRRTYMDVFWKIEKVLYCAGAAAADYQGRICRSLSAGPASQFAKFRSAHRKLSDHARYGLLS